MLNAFMNNCLYSSFPFNVFSTFAVLYISFAFVIGSKAWDSNVNALPSQLNELLHKLLVIIEAFLVPCNPLNPILVLFGSLKFDDFKWQLEQEIVPSTLNIGSLNNFFPKFTPSTVRGFSIGIWGVGNPLGW